MSLTFLPWLRAGLSGALTTGDDAQPLNRGAITIDLSLSGTAVGVPSAYLLGPGDVVGIIHSDQVLRTDPPNLTAAHETTRFVTIEFRDPAMPWSFTPAAATAQDRLRPWITLVVVPEQDDPGFDGQQLHVPGSVLPDLADAWAWAHVQIAGDISDIDGVPAERQLSRLISAQPLDANRRYLACVVPTFAAGRDAGLGGTPDPAGALAPAWMPDDPAVTLPVYYSWRFGTGDSGDFLSLALLLQGRRVPGAGSRSIDLTLSGLGDVPDTTLVVTGALVDPDLDRGPDVSPQLQEILSVQSAQSTADLGVPLYGALYAQTTFVAPGATGWLAELNLDPRMRLAAALGTAVVRQEQESLVAAAWDQLGDTSNANSMVDRAGLARAASAHLLDKYLAPLSPEDLVQVTAPIHNRVRLSPVTLAARLELGAMPTGVTSAAFRRMTRPRGPLMRSRVSGFDDSLSPISRARVSSGLNELARSVASSTSALRSLAIPTSVIDEEPVDGRLKAALLDQLAPERTVPARLTPRLLKSPGTTSSRHSMVVTGLAVSANDPLARTAVAPSFADPMYSALAALAPDAVLPGTNDIPANSVVLLTTDSRFVAAFMVGLNDELSRELVWRGLAIDRRATFFRHFWDFRGTGDGSADIDPIANWPPDASLESLVHAGPDLVLVLRGDLLRRYPRTIVQAVRAKPDRTPDDDQTLSPAFSGFIEPDLRFFGFSLSEAQARSSVADPGWFFVLLEQPTETRFGTENGAPSLSSGTAADVANATLRQPVRIAVHADDLLVMP